MTTQQGGLAQFAKVVGTTLARRPVVSVGPIFFAGTFATSAGITVAKNDMMVLLGVVLTGIGVIAMWLPGKGGLRLSTGAVLGAFVGGTLLTALSLTIRPTNDYLFWGMVLLGLGIVGMWLIGKSDRIAQAIAALFIVGNVVQAAGLTIMPSALVVMCGLMLVGAGIFGMWWYETREQKPEAASP